MHDSMLILQGLISVIGELNRSSFFKVLYPLFGCSVKTLKNYLYGIAENCSGDHLFERGHGQFYDELVVEGSLPIQTVFSYSVEIDPINSVNLELTIYDNLFKHIKTTGSAGFADFKILCDFGKRIHSGLSTDSDNPPCIGVGHQNDVLFRSLL